MCEEAVQIEPRSLAFVPSHFKTEGLFIKAVRRDTYALDCVQDDLKTQKICNEPIRENPAAFLLVPDRFKTQDLCEIAAEVDPWQLYDVPDCLKTQKICDNVVCRVPQFLQFIPDWFVTQEQLEIWHDDDEYCTDDEIIEWYKRYEKRKVQKATIKEELMPTAWHPDRVMDWSMPEDEKGWWK